jgi:hypothetical protein
VLTVCPGLIDRSGIRREDGTEAHEKRAPRLILADLIAVSKFSHLTRRMTAICRA